MNIDRASPGNGTYMDDVRAGLARFEDLGDYVEASKKLNSNRKDNTMMYTHVVFDDLREFSPAQPDAVYLRTVDEARTFFSDPDVCVDTLWLDFDLGLDTSGNSMISETIINELVERVMTDQPAPEIRSIYIVTANNVGQRRLMFSCPTIAPHVKVVNPIDYCLVNLQHW